MHQHVRNDRFECVLVPAPISKDRPSIQSDQHPHRGAFESERQADPLEQAKYLELAFSLQSIHNL